MIGILADQNFSGPILNGLKLRLPKINILRAVDLGIGRYIDDKILERAHSDGRVILTHDLRTFEKFAYLRIEKGKGVSGVVLVLDSLSIGHAIEQLVLVLECTNDDEWSNFILRLPI